MQYQGQVIPKKVNHPQVMMRYTALIFLAILSLLLITRCSQMNDEIKKSWWKYGSGYHIGDVLRFDDNNLKGDTIYSKNEPKAIISSCGKGVFRQNAVLEIKDLETGKVGTYHEKGPR